MLINSYIHDVTMLRFRVRDMEDSLKPTMSEAASGQEFIFPKTSMGDYRAVLLLAFARRVALGKAQQFECNFIEKFMRMELSERDILGDCMAAYNLTGLCDGIEQCDCSSFEGLFESWQADIPDEQRLGGE